MWETILIGILSSVVVGLLCWVITLLKRSIGECIDRKRVYLWLQFNTRDEPGKSHVDTITLAKETRLTEEQVHKACLSDQRIYRSSGNPELWSLWRQEPQSIYEIKGITIV